MNYKPYTVRELIAELKLHPPEAVVIMAGDEEGNHYADTIAVAGGVARILDGYHETYLVHPEDVDSYDSEDLTHCVVLWP